MSRTAATLIGFSAILMWAMLAVLTAASGAMPPFQMTATTFLIGGLLGPVSWIFRPQAVASLKQDWRVWALGICGLFSYHALYFAALKNAPAVEVSLIAYLWPLLIVVFSSLLPGERLRMHHAAGTALGLLGAFLVISRGQGLTLASGLKLGHLLALPLPLIWSGYSLLARRTGQVPTDVIAGFCIAVAALSFLAHLALEQTVWPAHASEWFAIIALGLLPVGAAFYTWDFGLKRGDIMVLGALSYASPLLSTLILVAAGFAPYHWSVLAACLLITVGAAVASRDMIFKKVT